MANKKINLTSITDIEKELQKLKNILAKEYEKAVKEGEKERIQQYQGVVIGMRGSGPNRTFTVRKMSGNIGVERIFPFNSPFIAQIDVKRRGRVRRAKLFYLRELRGKAARIKERNTCGKNK